MSRSGSAIGWAALVMALALAAGCGRMYYGAMEKAGIEKRELLVGRVQDARASQEEAKEQFQSALEQFQAVVEVPPSELEAAYKRLRSANERCRSRSGEVSERIDSVENVSEALFREWRAELGSYSDASLRAASERQLGETRRRYEGMIAAMRRAESAMQPVLARFNDQVLFLKHHLNAQAIASLEGELGRIQADVAQLVREMEASIAEADEFIAGMQQGS